MVYAPPRPSVAARFLMVLVLCLTVAGLAVPASGAGIGPHHRSVDAAADAYLRYSLGRLMELRGMLDDALVQYRRASAIDPGQCEIETAIARVLFTLGRVEDSLAGARAAHRDCPESTELTALLAAVALGVGNPALAESVLVAPASREDAPVELVLLLGQSLAAQSRAEEAEELLRARAEIDSLSGRVAYFHARLLLELGRNEEGASELLRAHELDEDNAPVVELATGLLTSMGREDEAVEMLESFVDGPGGRPRHAAVLARTHARLGNHARSVEVARSGLERFGEGSVLLSALGTALFEAGDVDESLEAYERILELNPSSVQALNFIAYTLADLELDADRAIALAEEAVALSPESGIVRDTLGWAYFRAGRFDDAVRELLKAVELGETDPVILEHLGDAFAAVGRIDEAVAAWQSALLSDPDLESATRKIAEARGRPADEGTSGERPAEDTSGERPAEDTSGERPDEGDMD